MDERSGTGVGSNYGADIAVLQEHAKINEDNFRDFKIGYREDIDEIKSMLKDIRANCKIEEGRVCAAERDIVALKAEKTFGERITGYLLPFATGLFGAFLGHQWPK